MCSCHETLRLVLTHWDRVTHNCVSKLTTIGSYNGLARERCQTIIWTNPGILLIAPLGTNFNEILLEIYTFSFKKIHFKMSPGKWRQFCPGLNMFIENSWTWKTWVYATMSKRLKAQSHCPKFGCACLSVENLTIFADLRDEKSPMNCARTTERSRTNH